MASSSSSTSTNQIDNDDDKDSKKSLFLLDFDGVICDSCNECTVSALRTCRQLHVLPNPDGDDDNEIYMEEDPPPPWLLAKMREIRPVIEVGWQIPVLLAIVLEQHHQQHHHEQEQQEQKSKSSSSSSIAATMTVEEIMTHYQSWIDQWLVQWNLTQSDLIDAFGGVRDAWMAQDLSSWLQMHTFYPGVPQALAQANANGGSQCKVITTKQQRFAIALCRHAGVTPDALPDDCIYGLGMYQSKSDVIASHIMMKPESGCYQPGEIYFFEDRWPTLRKCLQDERLSGVHFYLCSWGYVTPQELDTAQAEPRVQVIGLDDFCKIVATL